VAQAIRKSLRDFIAVMVLVVIALLVGFYLVQQQRLRIPVLEENPFQLKAEMDTAQSVTPGQGQTVRVAGVRVGDINKVELKDGRAIVTMAVDRKYLPVYKNATLLLRPKTGLKDMFLELDPGDRSAGEFKEGGTIPAKNTAPDTNLDEILEALDADTQAYLKLLLRGAGKGLEGRAKDLGRLFGDLGPLYEDTARLNVEVAKRRSNLKRLIHNLNVLTRSIGTKGDQLAELIDASNKVFEAIGSEDPAVRRTVAQLPGTLRQTRDTLIKANRLALVLGPTFNDLRPFARNLDDLNFAVRNTAVASEPVVRRRIRPFVRTARRPVRDLRPTSARLSKGTPRLRALGRDINKLGNMAAYNPNGAEAAGTPGRDEGYLYWAGWLGHNGNSVFQGQDANGLYRRIYFTAGCNTLASIAPDPVSQFITGLGNVLLKEC
jgi:phospholipid/cholesterol/gamma-HCH transport system substrate-binding protein